MNMKVLYGALVAVMVFPVASHAGAIKKKTYNLVPVCMEGDGRYRWEVMSDDPSSVSFSLQPTDNSGTSLSGAALASGSGDGSASNMTLAYTTKADPSVGGINWQLTVSSSNGSTYTYSANANTSLCEGSSSVSASTAGAQVDLCHIPPGNPANAHEISVGHPAYAAHMAHGDSSAPCGAVDPCMDASNFAACESSGVVY